MTISFATSTDVSPTSDFVQELRSAILVLEVFLTSAPGHQCRSGNVSFRGQSCRPRATLRASGKGSKRDSAAGFTNVA